MSDYPKYREEIFFCDKDVYGNQAAIDAGYEFYTYQNYPNQLYKIQPGSIDGIYLGYKSGNYSNYHSFPSKKDLASTHPFQDKVLEFVLSPERSDPNGLMGYLVSRSFFKSSTEKQIEIIHKLLRSDDFCQSGKNKFKNHMGSLLPEEKPKRFVYTVEVETEFDVGGGSIGWDTEKALRQSFPHSHWKNATARYVKDSKREAGN